MGGFFFALILGVFIFSAVTKLAEWGPRLTREKLSKEGRQCLLQHSRYYRKLTAAQQAVFESRVASFIAGKDFIPRNFDHVTMEMKTLIAGTAVQLTFGLQRVRMRHFQYIVIYPEKYFSIEGNGYHHGEVNPRKKAIVLSWQHFVETMALRDGRNLGLHEMAHALELENMIRNGEQDFFDRDVLAKWSHEVSKEIQWINAGNASFFRSYAASNHHEFFASAVEVFFELPQELRNYNSRIYYLLCVLLNQNPLLMNPRNA